MWSTPKSSGKIELKGKFTGLAQQYRLAKPPSAAAFRVGADSVPGCFTCDPAPG